MERARQRIPPPTPPPLRLLNFLLIKSRGGGHPNDNYASYFLSSSGKSENYLEAYDSLTIVFINHCISEHKSLGLLDRVNLYFIMASKDVSPADVHTSLMEGDLRYNGLKRTPILQLIVTYLILICIKRF